MVESAVFSEGVSIECQHMNPLQRVKSLTAERQRQSPLSLYSSLPLEALRGSGISFVKVPPPPVRHLFWMSSLLIDIIWVFFLKDTHLHTW